jgi:mRNA interferase RelE/StbE
MIKVSYKKSFLKDLKKIRQRSEYNSIYDFCFNQILKFKTVREVSNLKKVKGSKDFYRIKFNDYRIGLLIDNENIVFFRVLHRKDIYKFFPPKN